jgi:Fe2+ transport system protein FeoA
VTTSCPLCGLEYEPGGDACRAQGCPLARVGCATRHCPRCGYAVPDEEHSRAARFIRRLFRSRGPARTLAELPAGGQGVVARLSGEGALMARLTAHGLVPGTRVTLLQRSPAFVVELGETTLALERRVAEGVRLRGAMLEAMRADPSAVTSPADPRLEAMGQESVAGADQIPQLLAVPPRERLQLLLEMLAFEERAHRATLQPKAP